MTKSDLQGRPILRAGDLEAVVVPECGGRIGSLRIAGLEVLVTEGWGPLAWGAYPMVPWAGRLDRGVLRWRDEEHRFPTDVTPPHAIHGTLMDGPWKVMGASGSSIELRADLAAPWPFGGVATHRLRVAPDRLEAVLEVRATDRPFPAIVGWHPWFARRLRDGAGDIHGGSAAVDVPAAAMLHRGADGLPDGTVVRPIPPGPWDDCFTELSGGPSVTWPGALRIDVESDARYVVVYTEQESGVCVEPQTGPPNGLNAVEHALVEPGRPLVATMTLRWRGAVS
ncbi:MAG: aldose 1-epimerase [Chloroflexi bacterium]|jgi:aldose 1-epimerase|nr:aldose 1-epimerase [Chloroflexota bacterium]